MDGIAIIIETEEDTKKQLDNMNKLTRKIELGIAYNKTKTLNTNKGSSSTKVYRVKRKQVQIRERIYKR